MAAHRLPRGISTVMRTRSFCPSCEHSLAWYENIPILSYLALLGRCLHCRKPIGVRYLIVELLVTAFFVLFAYQFFVLNLGLGWYVTFGQWTVHPALLLIQFFLTVDLILLSVVDLESWLIPIETTLVWIPVGFVLALIFPDIHASATAWTDNHRLNALIDSFQGLVLGAGILWTIGFLTTFLSFFWFKLRGINARPKEGMGLGDCHLLGMIGALLGWKLALSTIFLGVLIGSVSGIAKILWDKLQHARLGDQWKPWQPTYEVSSDTDGGEIQAPSHWPKAAMAILILACTGLLFEQGSATFKGHMFRTMEESRQGITESTFLETRGLDLRLVPVYLMTFIGVLLALAMPFMKYLAQTDSLPQGSIVETSDGEKEEVLQGHYIPFGPSLAAAALIATLYDPLIRNFSYWFATGGIGPVPRLANRVMGGEAITEFLVHVVRLFNELTRAFVQG